MKLLITSGLLITAFFSYSQSSSRIASLEKKGSLSRVRSADDMYSLASSDFTTSYARCHWTIDPAVYAISGSVLYHIVATKSTNRIVFDLDNTLVVDSIVMSRAKLPFGQGSDKTLSVSLAKNLAAGQKDSLQIFYHGTPANNGFGSFTKSSHNGVPVIWTLSEPYGARDWWPCRNGLDDKIDSLDLYITHPAVYNASANGWLTDSSLSGSAKTGHFVHRYPIVTYLVGVAVTNYQTFRKDIALQEGTLPVTTTTYPESSGYYQGNIAPVYNALQLYDKTFGPYPFMKERYGQTQFGWGGGMEHQGNSFITSPEEYLMAHELGHQWFGDKVTTGSWEDIWLNEGFATYLADFFYTENYHPESLPYIVSQSVIYATEQPHGSVRVDDTTSVDRIFDFGLSYKKGAMLLRMLRYTLGDSAFFQGINQYIEDPVLRYSFARTKDLQRHLEAASGKKLDSFFKQWFYGRGFPSFSIQWSWRNNKAQLLITQTTSDTSVPCFFVPLPIRFIKGSQQKDLVVNIQRRVTRVELPVSFAPDTLLIDPVQYLVSKNNKSKKTSSFLFIQDGGLLTYPNPVISELFIRPGSANTSAFEQVTITNLSGSVVYNAKILNPDGGPVRVPVAGLSRGIYFLYVEDENGYIIRKKFVKQ